MVWVDFNVTMTFTTVGPDEQQYSEYEEILVAEFREFLVHPAVTSFTWSKLTS